MKFIRFVVILLLIGIPQCTRAQGFRVAQDSITAYDLAIRPTKAAFYSAVFPGLGQYYNRDYWHIPIVYAALGGSVYYWIYNSDKFEYYRDIYKRKKIDESVTEYSFDWLERAQKYYKKKKDLAVMLSIGVYALQIVWAGVEAHLDYFDTNKGLGFKPVIFYAPGSGYSYSSYTGASITWNF